MTVKLLIMAVENQYCLKTYLLIKSNKEKKCLRCSLMYNLELIKTRIRTTMVTTVAHLTLLKEMILSWRMYQITIARIDLFKTGKVVI